MKWKKSDLEIWLDGMGAIYLRELGIGAGNVVADFGCNAGNYSIPAAEVVGNSGKVFAIDQDAAALNQLRSRAASRRLENIIILDTTEKGMIELEPQGCDTILVYDVLHYLEFSQRNDLYQRFYQWLKPGGLLSVFPKHNKSDWPMWHLADLDIVDIANEIAETGFRLAEKSARKLIHDDYLETGVVLNLKK